MMTSEQIRKSFLDFFAARGHKVLAGTSLIPADPTTLFTSAGVQQFVPAFRGDVPVDHPRIVTCQKCLRADDIDEVGDATHCTFFEMLGNFSIGDYFKKEAIEWGWEYSIKELGLPPDRIWITVYPADEEAYSSWRKMGVPAERIIRLEENWWPLSDNWVGSTGACSELNLDLGAEHGCGKSDCSPACSCGRFVEYWNLVFPEFFQNGPGNRRPLERPGVDTGLGFERLVALLQGKDNIFETDLFQPIVEAIHKRAAEINPVYMREHSKEALKAAHIIADHSRAVAFSLAEGILPSNEGRGYVVRKLQRRANYYAWRLVGALQLGNFEKFIEPIVSSVCETMGSVYPEIVEHEAFIRTNALAEEKRFWDAIAIGFHNLELKIKKAKVQNPSNPRIFGEDVFMLYDTFGIPKELTAEIAREQGLRIDEDGFQKAMQEQRARSRAGSADKFAIQRTGAYQQFIGATHFVGYDKTEETVKVIGLIQDGASKESVSKGEAEVLLDRTPFYAEAGGQVGDRGRLETAENSFAVLNTVYSVEKVVAHKVKIDKGLLRVGDAVRAVVDMQRRQAIARAHTATHLLHYALRQELGPHALQHGSLVDADWFRFDFSHHEKLSAQQLERITAEVNRLILENHPVQAQITDINTAKAQGAMALFGEKYGEEVRMLQMGDFSRELCGGTHLNSTAEVGLVLIAGEGSVGAGLRRIEAFCGLGAIAHIREQERKLAAVAAALRAPEDELVAKIEALQEELRQAQRQAASLQKKQAGNLAQELLEKVDKIGAVSIIAARIPALPQDAMRALADKLVESLKSGVIVLAADGEEKRPMVAKVSDDLVKKGLHAGKLLGEIAKMAGGGGGGRADFAQASAGDPSLLEDALKQVKTLVQQKLG
jgi:alanyl-tRNA synthetase